MKMLVCFLFCFLLTSSLDAQLGIRGGIHVSDAQISYTDNRPQVSTSGSTDFVLGLFYMFSLGSDALCLQPELNYMGKGFTIENDVDLYEYDSRQFDLGGLLRLNIELGPIGLYLGAGPFYTYDIAAVITEDGVERDVDFEIDSVRRDILSIAAAFGLYLDDRESLFVEARYIGDLNDFSDLQDTDIKQRSLMLTGGFMF